MVLYAGSSFLRRLVPVCEKLYEGARCDYLWNLAWEGDKVSRQFMFRTMQCAHVHQLKWSGLWPEAMLALQTHNLALFKTLQHLELVLLWDF